MPHTDLTCATIRNPFENRIDAHLTAIQDLLPAPYFLWAPFVREVARNNDPALRQRALRLLTEDVQGWDDLVMLGLTSSSDARQQEVAEALIALTTATPELIPACQSLAQLDVWHPETRAILGHLRHDKPADAQAEHAEADVAFDATRSAETGKPAVVAPHEPVPDSSEPCAQAVSSADADEQVNRGESSLAAPIAPIQQISGASDSEVNQIPEPTNTDLELLRAQLAQEAWQGIERARRRQKFLVGVTACAVVFFAAWGLGRPGTLHAQTPRPIDPATSQASPLAGAILANAKTEGYHHALSALAEYAQELDHQGQSGDAQALWRAYIEVADSSKLKALGRAQLAKSAPHHHRHIARKSVPVTAKPSRKNALPRVVQMRNRPQHHAPAAPDAMIPASVRQKF